MTGLSSSAYLVDRFGRNHRLRVTGECIRDLLAVNRIPLAAVVVFNEEKRLGLEDPVPETGQIKVKMLRTYHLADLVQPPIRVFAEGESADFIRQKSCFTREGGFELYREHLDAPAMMRAVERDFIDGIRLGTTIRKGERYVLGLSGGRDSMALLCLLAEAKKQLSFDLVAVHLTTTVPSRETKYALGLAEDLGIETIVVASEFLERKFRLPTESVSRLIEKKRQVDGSHSAIAWLHFFMRCALEDAANSRGAQCILLGLMQDDLVASMLKNSIHGGTMLSPFRHKWGAYEYAYPLWTISKQDVFHYVHAKMPSYSLQSDATNAESGAAMRDAMYLLTDTIESTLPGFGIEILMGSEKLLEPHRAAARFSSCRRCDATLRVVEAADVGFCPVCSFVLDHRCECELQSSQVLSAVD